MQLPLPRSSFFKKDSADASVAKSVALDVGPMIEEAIAEVLAGRREAFRRVVDLSEQSLRIVVVSVLPDPSLVDDIVQEAYVRIYHHLSDYEPGTNVQAWLKAFARNAALTERRRWLRKKKMMSSLDEGYFEVPAVDPLQTLSKASSELVVSILELIEELPEVSREMVKRFYFQKQSTREIAQLMQRSESSVRVGLHRARAALIAAMQEEQLSEE